MKRLQVLKEGQWKYVFCYNQHTGIVTTNKYHLALKERDLEYFKDRFGNDSFRITKIYRCQMCNELRTDDPDLLCFDCTKYVTDEAGRADQINRSDW